MIDEQVVQVHSGSGPGPGKCEACCGTGMEITGQDDPEPIKDCPHCEGTGEIP